jgi:hypothetical protein
VSNQRLLSSYPVTLQFKIQHNPTPNQRRYYAQKEEEEEEEEEEMYRSMPTSNKEGVRR